MKRVLFYLFLFSCSLISTPLLAGTQTLTTYYPAPSGNYLKIQASSLQLTPSTLSAIQAQYKCSFDPAAGLPPCPAGLMYYDTDAQAIYISAGNRWGVLYATACVPLKTCSASFNCGVDSCGHSCGTCPNGLSCTNTTTGIPGSCS